MSTPPNDRAPWQQPQYGGPQDGVSQYGGPQYGGSQYRGPQDGGPQDGQSGPGQPGPGQPGQPGPGFTSSPRPSFPAPPRPQFAGAQQFGTDEQLRAELSQRTLSRTQRKLRGARVWAWGWALLVPIGVVAGSFGGYWYALNARTLDEHTVEQQVTDVLRDDFGFTTLAKTDCPGNVKIAQGESFQCSFEYAGGAQTVTVTQGSASGQLVVGAPEQH